MTKPRVTTVIPTFERPTLLARAIRSIRRQTYPEWRVDIYDNASTDNTKTMVEAVARADPRVRYHRRERNIGAASNFRLAVDDVATEFFSILSDDDVLLPWFYETAVATLDATPTALMVATTVIHSNRAGHLTPEQTLAPGFYQAPDGLVAMLEVNQPTWTGAMFRREAVERVGPLDEESVIDLDFELRLAAHHDLVVVAQEGAVFTADAHFAKCLEWPDQWDRTKQKLTDDLALHPGVRRLARDHMDARLRAMIRDTGLVALRMGRGEIARRAGEVLSDRYGDRRTAAILTVLSVVAAPVPWAASARRWLRRRHVTPGGLGSDRRRISTDVGLIAQILDVSPTYEEERAIAQRVTSNAAAMSRHEK